MQPPHQRLDDAMNRRRLQLDVEWNDVAAALRISAKSLREIRNGKSRPSDRTAYRIDTWMDWEPGSAHRLLDGGDPTPLPGRDQPAEADADDDRLRAALADWRAIQARLDEWRSDPEKLRTARKVIEALDDRAAG